MEKIIYINSVASDKKIQDALKSYTNSDWDNYFKIPKHCSYELYPRTGINNFLFKNELVDFLQCYVPKYDPTFNLTFSDITDLKTQQLLVNKNNKKWLIFWSGGIDSTVPIVSILKILSQADRERVVIACNRHSVYENPHFFFKYIKPNFTLIDSTNLYFTEELLNEYYIIDGELADNLYGNPLKRFLVTNNGSSILKNWRTDPDELINSLANSSKEMDNDKKFAIWFYEKIKENIESVDVPVENYYDFFWWCLFNYAWFDLTFRNLKRTPSDISSATNCIANDTFWYGTNEYQLWAMNNRLGVRYGTNIGERKLASKKYIYEFDHNEYYFKFKTKTASTGRLSIDSVTQFSCLTDDYTKLYIDRDENKIIELLPTHINLKGN